MPFGEQLASRRKSLGLSQESLAAQIQVSRQAVSKWETGDAAPDLPKLLALADALDISLDALCGREPQPRAAEPSAAPPRPTGRKVRWRQVGLLTLTAILLLGAAFWAGTRWPWDTAPAESALAGVSTLPESLSVSGVNFAGREDGVAFRFTPSVTGERYTYQITFAGFDQPPRTFDAPYSGGVCAGEAKLPGAGAYAVTVLVSDGANSLGAAVADNLAFDETSASWTPAAE